MTLDREGLLPCPFCGGKAEIIHIEDGENAGGSCVCCTQCFASSNMEFEFKENFVSNWNRRSHLEKGAAPPASVAEGALAEIAAERRVARPGGTLRRPL